MSKLLLDLIGEYAANLQLNQVKKTNSISGGY